MKKIDKAHLAYVRFHNRFHEYPLDLGAALTHLGSAERITRANAAKLRVATRLADIRLSAMEKRSDEMGERLMDLFARLALTHPESEEAAEVA